MLRRKLSSGLLRAANTAAAGSPAGSAPLGGALALSHAQQTQSAGLVSAVLIPSKKNWREQTVVELKGELKRRGLSQTGNKSTLVHRLSSSDTSAHLPAVPTLPKQRGLSTSQVRTKETKETKESKESKTDESVTTRGPEVETQRDEAPKKEQVQPELVTVAPGLPATKATRAASRDGSKAGDGMTPSIPLSDLADKTAEQIIPLEPDNFRSQQHLPTEQKSDTEGLPKILTVASGNEPGPSHAIYNDAVEPKKEDEDKIDLPGLGAVLGSIAVSPYRAVQSLGSAFSGLTIGAPEGKKGEEYKADDKPLDGEERRGAWILAGIVGAGLFFGGGGGGKKTSVIDKVKDIGGVKGDANWEKASGAGVVGHGARKT